VGLIGVEGIIGIEEIGIEEEIEKDLVGVIEM
jgi:hypothetical protein